EQFGLETCRRAPRPELGSKAHVESLTAERLRVEDSGQALLTLAQQITLRDNGFSRNSGNF
ncbi:MAG: hypothetical protein ACETWT_16840, partial [Thermodesulfobacteriota bacterium]